jgi:hypothetical protein
MAPPIGRITPAPRPSGARVEPPPATTRPATTGTTKPPVRLGTSAPTSAATPRAVTAPTPTVPVEAPPRAVTAPTPTVPVEAPPRAVTAPTPTVPVDVAAGPVTAPVPTLPAEPPAPAPADDGPLAAPAGWPDITDELAEVRFLLLQGFEDEAATMLVSLRARFEGHPDLERVDAAPVAPVPIDAAEKRRRDQAVTVRTEPVAAAAAAAAADASRRGAAAVQSARVDVAPSQRAASAVVATADAIEVDAIEVDAIDGDAIDGDAIEANPGQIAAMAPVEPPSAVTGATVIAAAPRERPPAVTGATVIPTTRSERPPAVSGATVVPAAPAERSPVEPPVETAAAEPQPPVTGETVIAAAPTAPPHAVAETAPIAPRPVPGLNARNASRVPPRGLTIRSEPVSDAAGASPSTDVRLPAARVVRPPDPTSLVAVSPIPRPSPAPSDSAAETLEFDVDAEFGEAADGATDPASMSTIDGQRGAASAASILLDDDSGETFVDLEFERLDRTVVSRNPPAPPVFDDEPDTGTDTRMHAEPVHEPVIEAPDRTVIARMPSAPAPWRGGEDVPPATPPARNTLVPTQADGPPAPAPFGGAPPPGSTLVPGTTPPPGGFADEPGDEAATIALPSLSEVTLAGDMPAPAWSPPQAPAVTGQTAPPGTLSAAPAPPAPGPFAPEPEPARAPTRGRGRKDERPGGVRLVMLGSRGESVAERSIEPGGFLDLGREAGQPWSDDAFIEPMHARFIAVDGGVRVEELVPTGAVFLRIQGRRPLGEHDQVRVGQSLLTYRRPEGDPNAGPWGSVVMHTAPDGAMQIIPLGNSGVTVGREFGEITLPGDTFVSSTHCRVVTDPSGIHIEDLESSNGTYVRMRTGEPLEIGQCVLVGQTQFVLRKR